MKRTKGLVAGIMNIAASVLSTVVNFVMAYILLLVATLISAANEESSTPLTFGEKFSEIAIWVMLFLVCAMILINIVSFVFAIVNLTYVNAAHEKFAKRKWAMIVSVVVNFCTVFACFVIVALAVTSAIFGGTDMLFVGIPYMLGLIVFMIVNILYLLVLKSEKETIAKLNQQKQENSVEDVDKSE